MKNKNRAVAQARLAANAHTNLNIFHTVKNILEGGVIYGRHANKVASSIIALCERAALVEHGHRREGGYRFRATPLGLEVRAVLEEGRADG